jgi:hypothetical protein
VRDDVVVALFNSGSEPLEASIALGEDVPDGEWHDLLGKLPAARVDGGSLLATIPSLSAAWFAPRGTRRAG